MMSVHVSGDWTNHFIAVHKDRLRTIDHADGCARLCREYRERDRMAWLEHLTRPALAPEHARAVQLACPLVNHSAGVLDFEVELGVWIPPDELGHCPRQRQRLVMVVGNIGAVMSGYSPSERDECERCAKNLCSYPR